MFVHIQRRWRVLIAEVAFNVLPRFWTLDIPIYGVRRLANGGLVGSCRPYDPSFLATNYLRPHGNASVQIPHFDSPGQKGLS